MALVDQKDSSRRPRRILMIAPTSFFSDYGCSVRILEEARALQKLGHRVTVCTYRNGQDVTALQIRRTPTIPFREHYEVGSSLHKVAFDLLLFWTVLIAAIRQRPDVIHAHMHEGALIGLLVGGLLRIPMVFDFQGSMTSEMLDHKFLKRGSAFYRPLRWLEQRIDHLSSAILTSSENAQRLLTTEFGCRPERVQTLADCVNGNSFYPVDEGERPALAERRASLGIPPGRRVVVYLGLLADYQGTDALLQAAIRVLQHRDDVHFLIMGFPAVDYYQYMAAQLGLAERTTFTGKVPYHQARDFLALGDVAVAPKLSATEGSGKILNYMAMGLPTVAFDTPVSREYLGNEGIYATPGDPLSLADGVLRALSETAEDRQVKGERLRQMALAGFSWDRVAERILQAYASVCRT
jgi:glycosyltransferase involved in cell wall biosynthesis